MPNQFLMDFMVARAARNNPAFAHQLMQSQEDARALKQAQALSKVLIDAIGSNPTGSRSPSQLPQLPIEKVVTPSSYSGPFANEINQAAQVSGLSPTEIAAVARRESNFDPNAQSPTGPQGPMQLSKAAAQDVGIDPNKRFDPLTNFIGGAKYLAKMKQEFGDNAYLAYHDGPGAVRSGNISDAGRQYQEQLRQDMANQQNNVGAVTSPEYTDTSKFLPNPMSGGSGLLGQDMDTVRRAYFEHLKQVAESGTPEAIAYVMKGLEDMRNAHMQDIQRTATQKELASTNLVPGTREYSDAMLRTMMKPSTQINMGGSEYFDRVMSDEDARKLGLPVGPGHAKYWKSNEGPKAIKADGTTVEQARDANFGEMAKNAHLGITSVQDKVNLTKIGVKRVMEDVPWIGELLSSQVANPNLSPEDQIFDNNVGQFVAAINRKESQGTVTDMEWKMATRRFIPVPNEYPEVVEQKNKNRESAVRMMLEGGGMIGQEKLNEFDKLIEEAKKNAKANPNINRPAKSVQLPQIPKPPQLPELPAGYKWKD